MIFCRIKEVRRSCLQGGRVEGQRDGGRRRQAFPARGRGGRGGRGHKRCSYYCVSCFFMFFFCYYYFARRLPPPPLQIQLTHLIQIRVSTLPTPTPKKSTCSCGVGRTTSVISTVKNRKASDHILHKSPPLPPSFPHSSPPLIEGRQRGHRIWESPCKSVT